MRSTCISQVDQMRTDIKRYALRARAMGEGEQEAEVRR